ncbi:MULTISPECIES: hypothetical protein [Streptomyces]|uniref:Uncharacterized protein n=1 Tax=Streptomyces katsurahamanus TaxID=2577098 RepID=A0ABW9P149_9ACTN|nr:hypothetical protein [Streptomyces katsurahamanus]MQS39317.1 hypothetical protein [Streptomyces katsurahamanus]
MAVGPSLDMPRLVEKMRAECRARRWPEEWAEDFAEDWARRYTEDWNRGYVEVRAKTILIVLEQRGIDIPDDARERINSCDDPETMHQWLIRSVTAPSAEAVFDDA